MRKFAKSSIFSDATNVDGSAIVVEVNSKSNPNKKYRVDLTHGRCSCPAWVFQKGERQPCKHLRELGFTALLQQEVYEVAEPKESTIPAQYQTNVEM